MTKAQMQPVANGCVNAGLAILSASRARQCIIAVRTPEKRRTLKCKPPITDKEDGSECYAGEEMQTGKYKHGRPLLRGLDGKTSVTRTA